MRRLPVALLVTAASSLAAGPAIATADGCAVVAVATAPIRSGPDRNHPIMRRVGRGQYLGIDTRPGDAAGRFLHVTALARRKKDGHIADVHRLSGWVWTDAVREVSCD